MIRERTHLHLCEPCDARARGCEVGANADGLVSKVLPSTSLDPQRLWACTMDPAFAKASARQACDCAGVCGVVLSRAVTLAPFLVGVLALAVLALRTPQVWRLRGIDALGVSVLAAVAALSLTATLFSSFQRLTGTTWSAGLAVMAAGLLLVKSSGDVEASIAHRPSPIAHRRLASQRANGCCSSFLPCSSATSNSSRQSPGSMI